jgi:hypothetical protein
LLWYIFHLSFFSSVSDRIRGQILFRRGECNTKKKKRLIKLNLSLIIKGFEVDQISWTEIPEGI